MNMHELESLQLVENKRICSELLSVGDKTDVVRMIVHKLEFISEYKRNDLLEELEDRGFEIGDSFVTEEGYRGLLFQRLNKTTLKEIDALTLELLVLLDEYDAHYGGWTTEVIK